MTKDQIKGLVGTIIVHLLLILLLLILALRTPLPLPGEEGVEVNFGYNETGEGNIQKNNPPPKAAPPRKKVTKPAPEPKPEPKPVPEPQQKEENLTQDTEEAPALEEKKEKKKVKKPVKKPQKPIVQKRPEKEKTEEAPKKPEKPKPVVNKRALYPGKSNKKKGQSQGITKGSGDQGKPHGYKESNRYDGQGGQGNGISFDLGGRGSKSLKKPETKVNESGTVVVNIWVNPQGKVVKASISIKGTDLVDPNLRKVALEAALSSRFEEDPTAPPEQRGTITYKFIKP